MEKNKFNYEKTIIGMTLKWINTLSYFKEDDKAAFFQFAYALRNNRKELFYIYNSINNGKEIKDDDRKYTYTICGEDHVIKFKDQVLTFKKEDIKKAVSILIDLYEDILPLGSVVELNEGEIDGNSQDHVRFMVTHRFIVNEGNTCYYTYGGVLYPLGGFAGEEIVHFNSSSIKKVIHMGFRDEEDKAFTAMIKDELILQIGMHSINFASKEEREGFN